jgi:NET1-associated nuclear protein 1 (U3 small nucleolar RNA-associated protein 17)
MGGAIACAAMPNVNADSSADHEEYLKDSIFLAVNRDKESNDSAAPNGGGPQIPTSVVFWVSLKRTREPKQVRLGKCKDAIDLSVSSDGSRVVVIGRKKIHIARIGSTTGSKANSGVPIEIKGPFLSFEGLPSQSHYRDVIFTTVVCHPTESHFATGDTRGTIRLWYILSEESLAAIEGSQEQLRNKVGGNKKTAESIIPTEAVTVWHWHAHAVSSLAFTPNGAYLISGGEEAVMVIWQISSQHKEFVPRLGAPIEALSIVNGQSGQQEYVARLKDGTLVFVGAGTLKVVRAVAGVKASKFSLLASRTSLIQKC